MSATTFPLARSMRVTVRASWLATHNDPPPTPRLCGLAPVRTGRPARRLVCGSIRVTLSPPALATHTAPGVTARSRGARPTLMVATVRPDAGSMRVTVSWRGPARSPGAPRVTHSAPSPTAIASASAGTRSGFPTRALVAGSIRTTVPAPVSTHSLPLATARLPGPEIGMLVANRARSKVGTVVPVGVGGGWVDRGLLGVSAACKHPAAPSRATATSMVHQRGAIRGDGRRSARAGMAHLDPPNSGRAPLLHHQGLAGSLTHLGALWLAEGPRAGQAVVASSNHRPSMR